MNLNLLLMSLGVGSAIAKVVDQRISEVRSPKSQAVSDAVVSVWCAKDKLPMTAVFQQSLYTVEAMIHQTEGRFGYKTALMGAYTRWGLSQSEADYSVEGLAMLPAMKARPPTPRNQIEMLARVRKEMDVVPNQNELSWGLFRAVPLVALLPDTPLDIVQSVATLAASMTDGHESVKEAVIQFCRLAQPPGTIRSPLGKTEFERTTRKTDDPTIFGAALDAKSAMMVAQWAVEHSTSYAEAITNAISRPGEAQVVAGLTGALWYCTKGQPPSTMCMGRLEAANLVLNLHKTHQTSKVERFKRQRVGQ